MFRLFTLFALLIAQGAHLGPLDDENLPPVDPDRVQEGDQAPDFRLADDRGVVYQLSRYQDEKNVVLVFYRGHW